MSLISENIEAIQDRIGDIAGNKPIRLIAVSKKKPREDIQEALRAGITDIGENRIQEAEEKFSQDPFVGSEKHFIGSLQSNKITKMLQYFDYFHALDSFKTAKKINDAHSPVRCLIQVNTSGEFTKSGLAPGELASFLEEISPLDNLNIIGLMTIGPLTESRQDIRKAFVLLRELREKSRSFESNHINLDELSMGMSHDFDIAIEEGATMVRIGTGIFGERK